MPRLMPLRIRIRALEHRKKITKIGAQGKRNSMRTFKVSLTDHIHILRFRTIRLTRRRPPFLWYLLMTTECTRRNPSITSSSSRIANEACSKTTASYFTWRIQTWWSPTSQHKNSLLWELVASRIRDVELLAAGKNPPLTKRCLQWYRSMLLSLAQQAEVVVLKWHCMIDTGRCSWQSSTKRPYKKEGSTTINRKMRNERKV